MPLNYTRDSIAKMLGRSQHRIEQVLICLSFLALALVAATELISPGFTFPWLGLKWSDVNLWLRTATWLIFVADFVGFALISRQPVAYARSHLLELIVCIAWLPHGGSLFNDIGQVRYLQDILSMEVLQVVGTIAHGWRCIRATAKRFPENPVYVTGGAATLLVGAASALLQHFEPQTFKSFWDAVWYCLATVTTIGYGDIVPHTAIGRAIGAVVMVVGISLAGVFIGIATEMVHRRLLKRSSGKAEAAYAELKAELAKNNALVSNLAEEQKATRSVLAQLLEEQKRAHAERTGKAPETSPAPPDSPKPD